MKTSIPTPLMAMAVTLGMGGLLAADLQVNAADNCLDCRVTAIWTLQSTLSEARSDYYLAVAKASTLTDFEARADALVEARETYYDDYKLAKEQYEARLQICQILKECRYDPVIDPAEFLSPGEIAANPNPYWPLVPGTTYRYRSVTEDNEEEITEVRITHETREILGVTCVVVRDTVWVEDDPIEDTRDWYAQDRAGNVWYFGELTFEFEDGEIKGLEGSFEAGVDGGKPGVIMLANPQPGDAYRQEMLLREAEDWAQVLALDQSVAVPYSSYDHCLATADYNPTGDEPLAFETKYYAPGVGFVLETTPSGGRVELIAIEQE